MPFQLLQFHALDHFVQRRDPGLVVPIVFGVDKIVPVAQQRCWPAVGVNVDQFGVIATSKL
jgi:hypothetical protein